MKVRKKTLNCHSVIAKGRVGYWGILRSSLVIDVQFWFNESARYGSRYRARAHYKSTWPRFRTYVQFAAYAAQGTPLEELAVNLISSRNLFETRVFGMMWFQKMCSGTRLKISMICRRSKTANDSTVVLPRKLLVNSGLILVRAQGFEYLTNELEAEEYLLIEGDNSWIHNEQLAAMGHLTVVGNHWKRSSIYPGCT